MKKILLPVLLALCLVALPACTSASASVNQFNATVYVQGLLDETYTGKTSDAYLTLINSDQDEVEDQYEKNIHSEYIDRLAPHFELVDDHVPDTVKDDFYALLETLYAKVSYTVKAAVPLDSTRYCVEVQITPVTFLQTAYADGFAALRTKFDKTHTLPSEDARTQMTDGQIQAAERSYHRDWSRAVLSFLQGRSTAITTGTTVTRLVLVTPDSSGYYTLSPTDFYSLDALVLTY